MVPVDLPHGWLTDNEANELRRLSVGLTVLELGAWKGRSTVVLAERARYVVSVDRHRGISGHDNDSLPDYLANVRYIENVAIIVGDFEKVVPLLAGYDMVYVDGDHDADSVARDLRLVLDHNPRVIAMHDFDFEEVRVGAREVLGRDPDGLVGSVASFTL